MKRPPSSFFQPPGPTVAAIIEVIVLHCVVSFEAGFNAHSNSTNGTSVRGLHFLNVYLTCGSGVMTDEVMKMVTVEPDFRDGYWNLRQPCISPEAFSFN